MQQGRGLRVLAGVVLVVGAVVGLGACAGGAVSGGARGPAVGGGDHRAGEQLEVGAPGEGAPGGGAVEVQAWADSARLMRVVRTLAHDSMQGRRIGTEGGAAARRVLLRELQARGIEPLLPGYEQRFTTAVRSDTVVGVNLLGVIRGTRHPERYIVASAHYDHVGVRNGEVYNGADDNASGTAALLELAGWFREHLPQNSIVIALLDGEEVGLRGARALLAQGPVAAEDVALNINLDMVGRNERGELFAVGTRLHPALRPYLEQAAAASTITLRFGHEGGVPGEQDWTMQSDQAAFHQRGIPFLYFGVEDHPDYHRPTDDAERLQPAFLAAAAALVIDVAARLDAALDSLL